MVNSSQIGVVVVAAGSGTRFGASLPKQFTDLRGKPVLRYCLDTFSAALKDAATVLVLSESGREIWEDYCRRSGYASPPVVPGGASRGESVLRGLEALGRMGLEAAAPVMVHDGARPLLTRGLIAELLAPFSEGYSGALPVLPMTDSMVKIGTDGRPERVIRSDFRRVQTPQVFRLAELAAAYRKAGPADCSDECAAILAAGDAHIKEVPGRDFNIKITNSGDLELASALIDIYHPWDE